MPPVYRLRPPKSLYACQVFVASCSRMVLALVADGRTTVFCEVRYRRSGSHGGAAASVDARKQIRLTNAARWYLSRHPALAREPCRFDVVAIEGAAPYRVDWLRDAFQPDN